VKRITGAGVENRIPTVYCLLLLWLCPHMWQAR